MSNNTSQFLQFLENLGAFESGIDTNKSYGAHDLDWLMVFDPSKGGVDRSQVNLSNPDDLASLQYHVHNTLGFLGKYQFGEPLLIDLGYYTPGPRGFYGSTATNEWQGTFTGKNGVSTKEDFMTAHAQEMAIREAFTMNMGVIEQRLGQAGHTIDDFLGKEFTYTRFGVQHTTEVTLSGILASAHLQGPGGVANLLLNGIASSDEYGTNILFYMDRFGGYTTPFGTDGNDVLSGGDYAETFSGERGDNLITTGGGEDLIKISNNPHGTDTITDFDVTHDVLSLAALGIKFNALSITNVNGQAEIHLPNQQKVVLEGVDAAQISASHFVNGPVTLSWAANSGDKIVDHFNLTHDVIDLNYAFGSNNLAIYEENGSSVIEVVGNNQRLILNGITLDQLNSFNFIKAPIDFATVFFGEGGNHQPPVVDDHPTPNPTDPAVTDPPVTQPPIDTAAEGVYSFTWSWGAHPVITDFDVGHDIINLQSFWTNYEAFELYDNASGHAVIDLTALNNQTITLNGVSVDDLSATNFYGVSGAYPGASVVVPDPTPDPTPDDPPVVVPDDSTPPSETPDQGDVYSYTWGWGSHAQLAHFDVTTDVINLQAFWTDYNAFDIRSDGQGNTVIDLTSLNNQSITLLGVSVDSLSAENIRGVNGNYQNALTETIPTPVPDNTGTGHTDSGGPTGNPSHSSGDADIFSFTWNWGADTVVTEFDVANDVIDLKSFWTSRAAVPIYDNADGNAVIDLNNLNNQTITLEGVSVADLSDHNVVF